MLKYFFGAAVIAGAFVMTSAAALACVDLTPNGSESTRIRAEPRYGSHVLNEVTSGVGTLHYCSNVSRLDTSGKRDDDGKIFVWLLVDYRIDSDDRWHTGWVAKGVVTVDDSDTE